MGDANEKRLLLFDLIENQNWTKVRRCLKSSKGYALCQERDESNLTCLAMALACEAPISIIEQMVFIDESLTLSRDSFGATALHVACLNGTKLECIRFLLKNYNQLGLELDNDLRTPLHHSVEYAMQLGGESETYIDVIAELSEAAPEAVNMRDNMGDTPLDLVQLMKIRTPDDSKDHKRLHIIYEQLRDTSIRLYLENKKQWETQGYKKTIEGSNISFDYDNDDAVMSPSQNSIGQSLVTPNSDDLRMTLSVAMEENATPMQIDEIYNRSNTDTRKVKMGPKRRKIPP